MYVDDIGVAGTKETIEQVGKNLAVMEKNKGYTFNLEKTNILRMSKGKKKTEKVKVELKKGEVKEVKKYKFLGNWMEENGTMNEQITETEKRAEGMVIEMVKMTKEEELGKMSTEARLLIYQRTAVPTITFNLECWSRINEKELDRLEKLQGKMLKRLLRLPTSTPTWGILRETGIWSVEMQIAYQRLMLYHLMVNADDGRLGKQVIMAQRDDDYPGWTQETERIARKLEIDLDSANGKVKSKWKREVKEKIEKQLKEQANGKITKKLRHQKEQSYNRKVYLKEMGVTEASNTLRRRLEMMDIGNNRGSQRKCKCGKEETIEHVMD